VTEIAIAELDMTIGNRDAEINLVSMIDVVLEFALVYIWENNRIKGL
jgi:biopolymer transport protein ExbD